MVDRRLPRSFFVPLQTFATSKRPLSFLSRASRGGSFPSFLLLLRWPAEPEKSWERNERREGIISLEGMVSFPLSFSLMIEASFAILYAMLLKMVFEIVPG